MQDARGWDAGRSKLGCRMLKVGMQEAQGWDAQGPRLGCKVRMLKVGG